MPRARGGSKTRQRRKKILKQAKGYFGGRRPVRGPVPQRNPGEAKDSGDNEGGAPTALYGDPGGEHGRDDLPEADAGLVDGVAQGALARGATPVTRTDGPAG